jgi:hypothetical protein
MNKTGIILFSIITVLLLTIPEDTVTNINPSGGTSLIIKTLLPSDDAVVYENDPKKNFGSHGEIGVNYRIGFRDRSFIMFDTDSIPPGSTITSATLNLYMYEAPRSSRTLACYEVTEGLWDESKITWSNQPEAKLFVSSVSTGTGTKKLGLNVKESLARFTWKDDENYAPNYGWMLRDADESLGDRDFPFWICSKEYPDLEKHPFLEVKYYPPKLELIPETSSMEAGTWIRITVYRKTSKGEPITRGRLRIKLASNSTSSKFSTTPGGVEVTELVILNELDSVDFYYYDEKAGTSEVVAWTDEYADYGKSTKTLKVKPGPLHSFLFEHISSPKIVAVPFSITITAYDTYGNVKTDYAGPNTLSDTTDTIEPKKTGTFKNGKWIGNVIIRKIGSNIKITTAGEGKTGESNLFQVIAGPPAKIRIDPSDFVIALGVAYSPLNISLKDANDFETVASTDILVNLSTSSPGGEFRECGTGNKISSILIPAGETCVKVDYYDTMNGTWFLTASTPSLEPGKARVSVKPDVIPPTAEVKIGDPKYEKDSKLYISHLTVFSISASDDLSGVSKIMYRVDEDSWSSYSSEFTLSPYPEGLHVITYFSIDKAGNREVKKNITVVLDKFPPRVEKAFPKDRLFSNSPSISFLVKANDSGSGIKEVELIVNNISTGLMNKSGVHYTGNVKLSEGLHNWSIKVVDNVNNNIEQNYSFILVIDVEPPLISDISQPSGKAFGELAIVTCRVFDRISGVREVYLCYSTDKGLSWSRVSMVPQNNVYSGSIPSQIFFTEVQYYMEALDNANNRSQTNISKYTVGIPLWLYLVIIILIITIVSALLLKRLLARRKTRPSPS